MKIRELTQCIEELAPRAYQESYDNAGLITGNLDWDCTGALVTLDSTEAVVEEAIENGCNLIIAHHPIIFQGLKSITGSNYVERVIIKAIKHDIAIYAAHTNLDNVMGGVNSKIASKIGLVNTRVLSPKNNTLYKLITFVPKEQAGKIREAMFRAGGGNIGNYSNCSFNTEGTGTFKGGADSKPTIGVPSQDTHESETKIEMLVPKHLRKSVLNALHAEHSYEEVAYDMIALENDNQHIGSGMIGELESEMTPMDFLKHLKESMSTVLIRHTTTSVKSTIKTVAVCGGVGSFLLPTAKAQGADIYVSADFKYHEFFDAERDIIIADIGHFESEQFTSEIFASVLTQKFPNFALRFSKINTNPINYM